MTFKEYSDQVKGFIPQKIRRMPADIVLHGAFGINAEAGEVASLFQKLYQERTFDNEHLMKEMGDVLWFLNEMAVGIGLDSLDEIAQINVDKLTARHHGKEYNAENDKNRKEGDV